MRFWMMIPLLVAAGCGRGAGEAIEASGTVEATEADLGFQAPGRIDSIFDGRESVHLEDYPAADVVLIDEELSFKMNAIRKIIGLGRSVRSRINIKTRQPLAYLKIYFDSDPRKKEACLHFRDVILEELNIKEMELIDRLESIVLYNIKPNLKYLGPKYGAILPDIKEALQAENPAEVAVKIKNEKYQP